MVREKIWIRTFFLSHFLEVIFSNKRDSGFGFVWSLLLHIDLKILLSIPERPLLWAVFTTRNRTLEKSWTYTDDKLTACDAPSISTYDDGENKDQYLLLKKTFVFDICIAVEPFAKREKGSEELLEKK